MTGEPEESEEPGVPVLPPHVRVAIVHDWLTGMRGGEKTLEAIVEIVPAATLFTLVHVGGSVSPTIERLPIRTSFLQRMPGARRYYRQLLPLFPAAIEQFDLDAFDLVISTSHCAAKAAVRGGRARHLCYCHTPMRYAWDQFDAYFGPAHVGAAASAALRPLMAWFARWDRATADRVDRFVANSQHVARRIGRYYDRLADVVYPPVDTGYFDLAPPASRQPDPYFLIVSALVPYKRLDLAVHACRRAGMPLKIAGDGPEGPRLRALAGPDVELLGRVGPPELRELYRRAQALLMPGEEDFGIAPVEAQACGCPVIALARGGALESVVDGETGILVGEPGVEAFSEAIGRLPGLRFDPPALRANAVRFSRARFKREMAAQLRRLVEAPAEGLRC
jgi:glycosyltransferase involved in cell wall biosynthesis